MPCPPRSNPDALADTCRGPVKFTPPDGGMCADWGYDRTPWASILEILNTDAARQPSTGSPSDPDEVFASGGGAADCWEDRRALYACAFLLAQVSLL